MNKKLLALALSAGMVLAGCGNTADETAQNAETKVEEAETKAENAKDKAETKVEDAKDKAETKVDEAETAAKTATSDIKEVKISLDEAIAKFNEAFGSEDIAIEEISLELENGEYEYEIEGRDDIKEYKLTLDANTGDIKAQKEEEDNDTIEAIDFASIISPEEAMEKALTGQEGAKVVEWSLSIDDGKTKYEIDVENGDDKEVDALTGEVWDD